jgi:hypothetical protein
VAFWYTYFYTTLHFVNQKNYATPAMQAHVLTHMHYFYSLNVIISHMTVYKKKLGYLSACAVMLSLQFSHLKNVLVIVKSSNPTMSSNFGWNLVPPSQ